MILNQNPGGYHDFLKGYDVLALTVKSSETDSMTGLGAKEIIDRDEVNDDSKNPLLKQCWALGIGTVGCTTLAPVLKSTRQTRCCCIHRISFFC